MRCRFQLRRPLISVGCPVLQQSSQQTPSMRHTQRQDNKRPKEPLKPSNFNPGVTLTPDKKKRKDTNLGKINRDYWAKESIKENVGSSSNCGIEDNSPSSLLLDHNYATEEVVVLADEEIETGGGASSQLEDTADEAGLATNEVTQTAKVSSGSKRTILARNKARTRRTSIQRQGLAYLQEYENTQNELKRKDQELLEEKLKIEEGKLELEKKRLELEERKLVLREFESKKNLQMQEDRFNELNKIISNQDRLINVLLNQTK
ncbi:hypothetical protein FQR65_LT15277 [Abscondita terminalis]|nr:hypothetical protein FQR65_LT15277 [Abscondita terminalis]